MVKLLDCTTRDGGYSTNWNYSDEYIFDLIEHLKINKINFFEIGYRNYYDNYGKGDFYYCTPNLIKKFYDKKGELSLGIMVDTKRYNESDFPDGNKDCVDFVRIATHPDRIKDTLVIAETLKSKNYKVMIQLMDISNLLDEHYELLKNWQNKNFLEVLYLADTYGIVTSDKLGVIYNKIKKIGYSNIGFHAHNKTQQALSNSLKVINLGAYSVDVVQEAGGINGGNLLYNNLIKRR